MGGPKATPLTRIHKRNQLEDLLRARGGSRTFSEAEGLCWRPSPAAGGAIPVAPLRAGCSDPFDNSRSTIPRAHLCETPNGLSSFGLFLQFQLWVLCSQGVKQCKEGRERTMEVLPCMICLLKNSLSFHEVIDPISVFIITLSCEKVVLNFNKGRFIFQQELKCSLQRRRRKALLLTATAGGKGK